MAKTSELGRKITWLRGEIARLQAMVDYLTAEEPEAPPKRERKKKAKAAKAEEGI